MLWEEMLSVEFEEKVREFKGLCAIPIGCMERHGHHLPLGCDTIKVNEFTRRAAEREPACVFPAMHFGEKSGAGEFPGTIIFPTPLIWQILEQSCYEIARNGFKKIVLVSGHGGNKSMLEAFCRYIIQKNPDFMVYYYYQTGSGPKAVLENREKFPYLTQEDLACLQAYVDGEKKDGHGGFVETSALYDVCPEWIDMERYGAVSGESVHLFDEFDKRKIYTPYSWMGNYPNSLTANYHEGVGERISKAIAEIYVEKTAEVFRFLKEETVSDEYHKEWLKKQKPHKPLEQ